MTADIQKTTEEVPLRPVPVTVIGTGAVTGGRSPMETGLVATTPAPNQPNLLVTVISPIVAISVRFGHLYFLTLSGIVGGAVAANAIGDPNGSQLIHYADFGELVWKSAQLSLAVPSLGLLKDLITIFGRLETKFPLLTGNV